MESSRVGITRTILVNVDRHAIGTSRFKINVEGDCNLDRGAAVIGVIACDRHKRACTTQPIVMRSPSSRSMSLLLGFICHVIEDYIELYLSHTRLLLSTSKVVCMET
ncbi:hypothetical protein V6N13_126178 [Hibiscus sabdariffa]|uniref:Uncharacterized protein n=2 Tax=Hibiscus sabdariffa TaxID=183260 RepID=A0ABR2APM4_9ROSI